MSTTHPLINEHDLTGMINDLKDWPNTAIDNGSFELSITPFLTFYFNYDADQSLRTTLDMIDVHEAFERLLGRPYTIATHPRSERPHRYGSVRLGDLREWAKKIPADKNFTANFTDETEHKSSPKAIIWHWMHEANPSASVGARVRSGEPCPYPGSWTCEEVPTGPQTFAYQVTMPQVNGQDVTWVLVTFLR